MLANVREEYAFKVIDPAVVPEKKYAPSKRNIVIVSIIIGLLLSAFSIISITYIKNIILSSFSLIFFNNNKINKFKKI